MTLLEAITSLEDFSIFQEEKPKYDLYPQSDNLKEAIKIAINLLNNID